MFPTTQPEFFVQLSDPHVVTPGRLLMGRIDTAAHLARAVDRIAGLPFPPSHVLVTGDLVDCGSVEEYAHLEQLLSRLPCPCLLMPGNHDSVPALRQALPGHHYLRSTEGYPALDRFVMFDVELGSRRLLALDTVVTGHAHGALCEERLSWLRQRLQEHPDRPTVVAMHHPPFQTGISHMDAMGLLSGSDELRQIVERHSQVERILCGHLHRPIARLYGRTLAMTAPSTAHQITLDLRIDGPATYTQEPPGFYIHSVQNGQLVSHLLPVGDFGPVHPFQ